MPKTSWLALSLVLCSAAAAAGWAPQAHHLLGRAGAESSGYSEADRTLAASGSLLADLDHALAAGTVIADTPAFVAALEAATGSPASGRFVAGWRAHVRAQDPGQGEISSRLLKLHADLIVVRRSGQEAGGAVFDAERIRRAAIALHGSESVAEIEKAVEKLVVFSIVEGALLDMLPLHLDEPLGGLPSARSLMPPEMAHHERRLDESLAGTVQALGGAAPQRPARPCRAPALAADLELPPAPLLGISVKTRTVAGGLRRTTVRLAHPWMFRAAARLAINRMGKQMFPTVVDRWSTGLFIAERTRALELRLERASRALETLFPE